MSKKDRLQCTCCGKNRLLKDYYLSQSYLYKGIGVLPICKSCIDDIYNKYKNKYLDDRIVIFNFCRLLDIPFSEGSFIGATQHSEKTGWKLYQSYFKQINSFGEVNNTGNCFEDGQMALGEYVIKSENDIDSDVRLFWGCGFNDRDYIFLENELTKWKQTHRCDNRAELTLLKEICIKILQIRNKRESNENVSKDLKELQEIMKTAAIDPAKAKIADAGKSHEAFGVWIKDIEQFRPAEWHDKQKKYKDMDGFIPYINDYIVRPIRNFITGSRDFQVSDNIIAISDDEVERGDI